MPLPRLSPGRGDTSRLFHNQDTYRNLPAPVTPVFVAKDRDILSHIQTVTGKPLAFHTRDLIQPRDVSLIPFCRMHHQRYSVYFETFTPDEWMHRQAELRFQAHPGNFAGGVFGLRVLKP